jgi:hypothetical protein
MIDVLKLSPGDLINVTNNIKDVIIYHGRIGKIKENQVGVFLGCTRYNHRKDTFWAIELLLNGKKVMMFSPTNTTTYITKIEITEEL